MTCLEFCGSFFLRRVFGFCACRNGSFVQRLGRTAARGHKAGNAWRWRRQPIRVWKGWAWERAFLKRIDYYFVRWVVLVSVLFSSSFYNSPPNTVSERSRRQRWFCRLCWFQCPVAVEFSSLHFKFLSFPRPDLGVAGRIKCCSLRVLSYSPRSAYSFFRGFACWLCCCSWNWRWWCRRTRCSARLVLYGAGFLRDVCRNGDTLLCFLRGMHKPDKWFCLAFGFGFGVAKSI